MKERPGGDDQLLPGMEAVINELSENTDNEARYRDFLTTTSTIAVLGASLS